MQESIFRMSNTVIGRPKKSSAELRDSGARTGRIKAREAEERLEAGLPVEEKAAEEKAPAPKMGLGLFIERVKHERKTFFERLVPGQTVCKDFEGEFTWKPEHALTIIRTYAEQVVNGGIVAGGFTRQACARFLGDLSAGADRELFIDLTSPCFCTTASERVYITANGCEIGFVGTPGLQAAGAGGL